MYSVLESSDLCMKCFSSQQGLYRHLNFRASLLNRFPNQAVAVGIRPVNTNLPFIQKVDDGPLIINICPVSKRKPVIPFFDQLFRSEKPTLYLLV